MKCGAMGNMITDGMISSCHNKNINKNKHWKSEGKSMAFGKVENELIVKEVE